ncbi:B3 domain-containing protein REM20-like [Vigna unguiculata]|uniref:B3 domain-containing protein REM20-like n=1 Tax=Vigna unguiculata TaxID=3917 RepID=UPI001016CB43|nr:B3 domain-containing protein REM20-like [Vigna unguiculata]
MTSAAKEYFFKIFSPEKHSETMVIPSCFVKSVRLGRRRIPKDIILRNVSGRVWCVKTRLVGHKIYFQEGWKVFQEENCIRKADFLLFKYDGTNVFKVVILEQSSRCERREVEEDEVIDITEEEENENSEDSMMEEEEDSDDEDEYLEPAIVSFFCISYECMNQFLLMIHLSGSGDSATSSIPKTEDPHLEDYEFDPRKYIQHENPYFEAKLYKNRPNELHVPANVLRDSSLTFPEEITLSRCRCFQSEDTKRNELRNNHCGFSRQTQMYSKVTKVSEWQDGRVCIKGWTSFCTKNKIKENDVCICEIVSGKDQIVRTLQVHVLGARNG